MRSGVFHEVADRVFAGPFDVGDLGFQPHDVLLGELQLGRIFDRHDPLLIGNEIAEAIEQRRFAGARAAGDENISPSQHRRPQEFGGRARHRAFGNEVVDDHLSLGKLPDRERWSTDGERRDHRVHAAAIRKPGIHERLRAVDAAAHIGNDPLNNRLDHGVRDEPSSRILQVAGPLDVNVLLIDDHDF